MDAKEEFVKRCCEMMEIDEASNLTFAGIVDLLGNIYEYQLSSLPSKQEDYKAKYEKCIEVIKKFDAGIIGMYDL